MIITIDFETWDPYLKKLGSGWVHGMITVLGASIKVDDGKTKYYRNKKDIISICEKATTLIAHNAQYDLGILMMWGMDLSDKVLVDTLVLAVLNDNTEERYSLDYLSNKYLGMSKNNSVFADVVYEHKLYKDARGKHINTKEHARLLKYAMANLHEIENVRPELVEEYCNHDVEMCYGIYKLFEKHVTARDSEILKILLESRQRGIRVDIQKLKKIKKDLKKIEDEAKQEALEFAKFIPDFNINSTEYLSKVYDSLGVTYPKTAPTDKFPEGQPSIRKEWVEKQTDDFSKALLKYKQVVKARRDYCDKPLAHDKLLPPDKKGRVYPEFKLYGARATGRFTCVPLSAEALTKEGWKTYDELKLGEEILAYDMVEGIQKWTPLLAKHKFKDQEVGSLGLDTRRFRCTKDHKWVVRKSHDTIQNGKYYKDKEQLVEAGAIKKGHRLVNNAPYFSSSFTDLKIFETEKYKTDYIKYITEMSNEQLTAFVLGFLLADGHNSAPTKVGTKYGWQWTQAKTVTREQLLVATYLQHSGRIGVGRHSYRNNEAHNETSRVTMCHSPYTCVSKIWAPETIEDVWCPTTALGTWVMRQGDLITITGNCSSPNMQQLPSHDGLVGPLIRSCYIPEEGEKYYHMDFSAQEPRLQVHYASLINAEGSTLLVQEYKNNPKLDLHQLIANIAEIERKQAKTINLGISYGMGIGKLSVSLGLNEAQATELRNQYNSKLPYLKHLANYCKKVIESRGYIKTLNGRQLKNEYGTNPVTGERYSFGYKAINKLIQGSATDQLINCMIALRKAGIPILSTEHDAISFSLPSKELALKAKHIMETCGGEFNVPMVVDMGCGDNWAEAK